MLPSHPKSRKSKYPKIDHSYESADYPGLYYAGAVTHSLDLRKSAGGFIHGFRYTGKKSVSRYTKLEADLKRPPPPLTRCIINQVTVWHINAFFCVKV